MFGHSSRFPVGFRLLQPSFQRFALGRLRRRRFLPGFQAAFDLQKLGPDLRLTRRSLFQQRVVALEADADLGLFVKGIDDPLFLTLDLLLQAFDLLLQLPDLGGLGGLRVV